MKYLLIFNFFFVFIILPVKSQNIKIQGPSSSHSFGRTVTVLTNGNYVITDPDYSGGPVALIGAVYLYDGKTHKLISTLKGSTYKDRVGEGGVKALANGNYIVMSPEWRNGAISNTGAVTWCDGDTGLAGVVSISNSLVGTNKDDYIGAYVTVLPNSNYIVVSQYWNNGAATLAGAVTWGNGNTGVSGIITKNNSLVGSKTGDQIGTEIIILTNSNYVVLSRKWGNNTTPSVGAATWCNGNSGVTGEVSSLNSLTGSKSDDYALPGSKVVALTNGNYVVTVPKWDNNTIVDAGAVAWGNGSSGTVGVISAANALIGTTSQDYVGFVTPLSNGHYVVSSNLWDDGVNFINVGAVTWCNGISGRSGVISNSNSLTGDYTGGSIGSGVTALKNGNYVVTSNGWGGGAVTWCNGNTGRTGSVSIANSLTTANPSNNIGNIITALSNGHYVVTSYEWDNGTIEDAGAVTWCNGITGTTGVVNASNSLVGTKAGNMIGYNSSYVSGVVPLKNGNYVVCTGEWSNDDGVRIGAVTWCNGFAATAVEVSSNNSLIGTYYEDKVGSGNNITVLANGNYVVASPLWGRNRGAITWCNGSTGISGTISSSNSLIGKTEYDQLGSSGVYGLANGNYVIGSENWDSKNQVDAGALTWCNGSTGLAGFINSGNSLIGSQNYDKVSIYSAFFTALDNGSFVINNYQWNHAGAVSWFKGSTATTGFISDCNSVLGNVFDKGQRIVYAYNNVNNYVVVGKPEENMVSILEINDNEHLAIHKDKKEMPVTAGTYTSILNDSCRLIASLLPKNNILNTVSKIWIESVQPDSFIKRHYQIIPTIDTKIAKATLTLYATQIEFDSFNTVNTLKLPVNSNDQDGKSLIRIMQYRDSSNNATGLPGSYTGGITIIDPDDKDIIWDEELQCWAISFDVNGLGGFFITASDAPSNIKGVTKFVSLKLYPNPTNGVTKVELYEDKNIELKLSNLCGDTLLHKIFTEKGTYELDLSNQPSGIYLLKLSTGEVFKLVKF